MLIGLTGSIGTGKSAAANIFASLGARIIDADILAREVVAPGTPGLKEVEAAFGPAIIRSDGTLDRGALGIIIFNDAAARKRLESILHPKIRKRFLETITTISLDKMLVIYVVPLLFESQNLYEELEKIIVVSASPTVALARIMKRDNCSEALARKKLQSQMPIAEKEKRADIIIWNEGTEEELRQRVAEVFHSLTRSL